ncbi:6-phosphogluconolactonase [Roseateles sp. YR242]|uniref:lactonase family protein n=1 Tax=Roseateles sp. YR242 TaxID=1855305 RepID=UPI0008AFDF31|nr:beta-propeller fold lactonase family protein [Roseateles sp. YR242]SEK83818.1 6-phosphogluconolactonase [Roseateles sp. YR242]
MNQFKKRARPLAAAIGLSMAAAMPVSAKTFVYVANAEDGDIDAYVMDVQTGALAPVGKAVAGKQVMPMALSPDKRHLYAVVRSKPWAVLSYKIDAQTGKLEQQARAPLPESMAYVSTDATGRFLLTASYGASVVAVSPIESSGLVQKDAAQVLPTGKNAHSIRTDASNKFAYAAALGGDQIHQFKFDAGTGQLTAAEPAVVKTPTGSGPRHIVFSRDQKFLYVLHELSGTVDQYAVDPVRGTLSPVGSTQTVPKEAGLQLGLSPDAAAAAASAVAAGKAEEDKRPRVWAADLQLTPDGRFLYATDRTTSKIALLRVAEGSGRVSYVANFSTETQPRGIRIDPTGQFLVATGQKSDKVTVYRIDPADGGLTAVGRYPVGKDANWVEIVSIP